MTHCTFFNGLQRLSDAGREIVGLVIGDEGYTALHVAAVFEQEGAPIPLVSDINAHRRGSCLCIREAVS